MFNRQNVIEMEENQSRSRNKLKEGKRKANTNIARTRKKKWSQGQANFSQCYYQTCQKRMVKVIRIDDYFVKPIDMESGVKE